MPSDDQEFENDEFKNTDVTSFIFDKEDVTVIYPLGSLPSNPAAEFLLKTDPAAFNEFLVGMTEQKAKEWLGVAKVKHLMIFCNEHETYYFNSFDGKILFVNNGKVIKITDGKLNE